MIHVLIQYNDDNVWVGISGIFLTFPSGAYTGSRCHVAVSSMVTLRSWLFTLTTIEFRHFLGHCTVLAGRVEEYNSVPQIFLANCKMNELNLDCAVLDPCFNYIAGDHPIGYLAIHKDEELCSHAFV
jgi:hypothetical protein